MTRASFVLLPALIAVASSLVTACGTAANADRAAGRAEILLYEGTGASPRDVDAVVAILTDDHLSFSRVDSAGLSAMNEASLRKYRLILIPGGDFTAMADSISPQTAGNIRDAVRDGVSYLGICGGGFLAGRVYDRGLNLTGVKFGFYSAEARGIRKMTVAVASPDGPTLDQYWEDGPQFSGWGSVIGKYPDGSPAAVEGRFGMGRVILIGVHAEAPESWRGGMRFATPAEVDNAYASRLIRASLTGQKLAHY